jgi:hypothetical protein
MDPGVTRDDNHPHDRAGIERGRVGAAAIMVVLGAAAVVYAAAFHVIPVLVDQAPPSQTEPAETPDAAPAAVETPPAQSPQAPAPALTILIGEPEPLLVREVSVGGVARLPSGEIKRTYAGSAPPQCPT